jgi:superfamily II DNA helicase RecQ
MPIKLFQCPLPADPELTELNAYLNSHRVATVAQHVVQTAGGAMLVFVVESPKTAAVSGRPGEQRIDYRERLSPDDFALYAQLRAVRKELSDADGVPAYSLLSNAELARIVERRPTTEGEMEAIKGIGKAKVAKLGPRFLPIIAAAPLRSSTPVSPLSSEETPKEKSA